MKLLQNRILSNIIMAWSSRKNERVFGIVKRTLK